MLKSFQICCRFLFLLTFLGLYIPLSAQESVNTTGKNASGSGGTVSYSVGQTVYNTFVHANYSVSQGVQQPYEISVISSAEAIGINIYVSVYPNPATDYLFLKTHDTNNSNYTFHLYDTAGRLIQEGVTETSETKISMREIQPSTYYLKVFKYKQEVKLFKIVKM